MSDPLPIPCPPSPQSSDLDIDPSAWDDCKSKATFTSQSTGTGSGNLDSRLEDCSEDALGFGTLGRENSSRSEEAVYPEIWVHLYHTDKWVAFLNDILLKRIDLPVHHVGVEVNGTEWSFQFFEDTWEKRSVTGVTRCVPRCMPKYHFVESVYLGPSKLSLKEIGSRLCRLSDEWPACEYHLTRKNCLTFARTFVEELGTSMSFPDRLTSILEASNSNAPIDALVDYGWSWAKWNMVQKHGGSSATCSDQDRVHMPVWPMWCCGASPMVPPTRLEADITVVNSYESGPEATELRSDLASGYSGATLGLGTAADRHDAAPSAVPAVATH